MLIICMNACTDRRDGCHEPIVLPCYMSSSPPGVAPDRCCLLATHQGERGPRALLNFAWRLEESHEFPSGASLKQAGLKPASQRPKGHLAARRCTRSSKRPRLEPRPIEPQGRHLRLVARHLGKQNRTYKMPSSQTRDRLLPNQELDKNQTRGR